MRQDTTGALAGTVRFHVGVLSGAATVGQGRFDRSSPIGDRDFAVTGRRCRVISVEVRRRLAGLLLIC